VLVKLKVKLNKRLLTVLGVAALMIIALMVGNAKRQPRPDALDSAAVRSCDDFAVGYPGAGTRPARLALADKVMTSGRTGHELIRQRQAEMGRSAGDGGARWKASADALLAACRDAGWIPAAAPGGGAGGNTGG
jgi:hypothetical protein